MMNPARSLIVRANDHDRQLLLRLAIGPNHRRMWRSMWIAITHLGGAHVAIGFAVAPFFVSGFDAVGGDALLILVLSHLIVQMIKRTVSRPRPSQIEPGISITVDPDKFSFPSGHSSAAMAVAIAYTIAFPALAGPLMIIAMTVGASRVMLGAHYPGDVIFGQLISLATAWLVATIR